MSYGEKAANSNSPPIQLQLNSNSASNSEAPVTKQILIYQSEDGRTKLDVRLEEQTV